jgi:hypothetical protein
MFSTSLSRRIAISIAMAATMAFPAIVEAAIVVASSGPSARDFPVGKKLDDNAKVTLRDGDTVTLLDQKGTRVLRGAGTYAVKQSGGPSRASTFVAITRQRASQRVRTGAVRNGPEAGPVRSPNLWYVDVAAQGPRCVTDTDSVRLWRKDAASTARYVIRNDASGASMAVSFDAGTMVAPWDPAKLPVTSGANYTITGEGGAKVAMLSFVVLGSKPINPEGLAGDLIAHGCTAQLDLLASSLTLP